MNRLKRELISRNIIYENEDCYEEGRNLIALTPQGYIITFWGSNVMPTEIHLFDRNFRLLGKQDLFPERMLFREGYSWYSQVFTEEDYGNEVYTETQWNDGNGV